MQDLIRRFLRHEISHGFSKHHPPKKTRLSGLVLSSYIFSHQPGSRKFLSFQKRNFSNIRIRTPQKKCGVPKGVWLGKGSLAGENDKNQISKRRKWVSWIGTSPSEYIRQKGDVSTPNTTKTSSALPWLAPVFIPHAWSSCCSRCLALSPPLLDPAKPPKENLRREVPLSSKKWKEK